MTAPSLRSGVSVVMSPAGVTTRATGRSDRVAGRDWTLQTQSQIASISKQFVAACALTLVSRSVLRPDDTVSRFLPDAVPGWNEVRVQDLLTHTSGLPHWIDRAGFVPQTSMPVPDRLALLLAIPPAPGPHEFGYSSPGYIVLSAVLAAAAGCSYTDLARELVVEPLGLSGTSLGSPGPGVHAVGYHGEDPVESWDLGGMPGTGDVWSTAGDIARFLHALHTGEVLPNDVQHLLYRPAVPCPSSGTSRIRTHAYAAGHFVGTVDGHAAHLHPGDNPGYQSLAIWLPHADTVAVLLSNDETDDIESEAARLLDE